VDRPGRVEYVRARLVEAALVALRAAEHVDVLVPFVPVARDLGAGRVPEQRRRLAEGLPPQVVNLDPGSKRLPGELPPLRALEEVVEESPVDTAHACPAM
jgi:hypothetical protein